MARKTVHLFVRVIIYGGLLLIVICGGFLYRGQQKLLDLVNHRSQKSTDVYSAWVDLAPGPAIRSSYLLATLRELGYDRVSGSLQKIGQYSSGMDHVDLWSRGFAYPDHLLAPKQLRLTFSGDQLAKLEDLTNHQPVLLWRLEPKLLAQWASHGGAAQPKVLLNELPAYVPQAVIAIEDKRYYQHGAIDLRGLLRAMWVDLHQAHLRQGGSTLSQQLSRSIFLDVKRTWTRKVLEAGLAFYLEARYSKAQLLEMYLNQVYWGQDGNDSLLGLESASRSLFGKPARDLTLAESALLAGLLQSPNRYSPRVDIKIALQRRNLVLALMQNQGFITTDQFKPAIMETLHLAPLSTRAGKASYFVSTLQETLVQQYSLGVLLTEGWQIYTTLDPVLQSLAVSALKPSEGQAALVAIDPRNGALRAWVGGTDYAKSSFDRVVYAKRQPGSAFKPFVMLAALDTRKATMATMLEDQHFQVKTPQGNWSPQNYDRKYRGKVSLWDALVNSINVPTVHLAMQVGLDKVANYAHYLGIQSALRKVPALALGTSEVTVLELTSAYATLANAGRYAVPYCIETIMDENRKVKLAHTPNVQAVVAPESAFLVTQMLEAVMEEGTAKRAKQLGFTYTAAGKTGTSDNYQDAWFVGYTPSLACGVWVGYDQPRTLGRAAAGIALPIWVSFMQKALAVWPETKFEEPKDLVWKTIDINSGTLARSGCPHRRKEAFLIGTSPTQLCPLHPGGLLGLFYRWRGNK